MRRALALLCLASLLQACGGEAAPDPAWVEIYDPEAAAPGYNLILFRRRTPMLIDMNGNAVHRWPVKVSGRARLLRDGGLLTIGVDGVVRELDWDGGTRWEFRLPGEDFAHHDLIPLENGNRLVLAHDEVEGLDYLLELNRAGAVVWEWRAKEHLAADLERARRELGPKARVNTHVNSVHELPPNRWFDGGDVRFRPGNILISARNLNTIYILDRSTGVVVWRYDQGLDHQHEATMIPRGYPGEGDIVFFNNGLDDLFAYRRSSVEEIDPVAGTVVWSYRAPNFFSSTAGTQQPLENGNVLVTSSRGGRMFEVTRDGRIVWQWTPRYLPMREHRYPYDFCPQLARLPRPRPLRIDDTGRRHVDRDLYDFALGLPKRKSKIGGRDLRLLASANVCREIVLPERPTLGIGYGFEKRDAEGSAPAIAASVRVTPRTPAEGTTTTRALFERELRLGEDGLQPGSIEEKTIDLSDLALQTVEMCFAAAAHGGGEPDGAFFWTRPLIRSAAISESEEPGADDAAQRVLQEKHLKALGYVD